MSRTSRRLLGAGTQRNAPDGRPHVGRGGRRPARPRKDSAMKWDQIERKWTELKGRFAEKWGKLTDDDLTAIGSKRDRLSGFLQQRYGVAEEHVEKQIALFERRLDEAS
jgi:uncharacterized protein YjbJ (UPF0337 family)